MSPGALILSLAGRGVRLRIGADGRLRYQAPRGVVTDADLEQLRAQRDAIRGELGRRCQAGDCLSLLYDPESIGAGVCASCRVAGARREAA